MMESLHRQTPFAAMGFFDHLNQALGAVELLEKVFKSYVLAESSLALALD